MGNRRWQLRGVFKHEKRGLNREERTPVGVTVANSAGESFLGGRRFLKEFWR